jgi:hypothetical protein
MRKERMSNFFSDDNVNRLVLAVRSRHQHLKGLSVLEMVKAMRPHMTRVWESKRSTDTLEDLNFRMIESFGGSFASSRPPSPTKMTRTRGDELKQHYESVMKERKELDRLYGPLGDTVEGVDRSQSQTKKRGDSLDMFFMPLQG